MAKSVFSPVAYDKAVADFVKRVAEKNVLNEIVRYSTEMTSGPRFVTITFVMDDELANFGTAPEQEPIPGIDEGKEG